MRKPYNGDFKLTQVFGVNPDSYKQFNIKGHNGLDFALPTGTPVLAPHGGTVKEAQFDKGGFGNYVKIENDVEGSVLAHLSGIQVAPGFVVKEGDQIGLSGSTGNSTGAHLHWGYYRHPRNRQDGYGGFIDPTPYLPSETKEQVTYDFKYNNGADIRPLADIPVGAVPGMESLNYGKINAGAPAKVIGRLIYEKLPYYNIDQSEIGGGTGWARADLIDTTPFYHDPVVIEEKPKESIDWEKLCKKMQEERDEALARESETNKKYIEQGQTLSAFNALGFYKPDDITKLLKEKDEAITGTSKQLLQVLERSKKLAEMVADKDNEDFTAIEEGMKAMKQVEELRTTVTRIAKETGASPNLFDIVLHIKTIKKFADRFFEKAKEEAKRDRIPDVKREEKPVTYDFTWLQNFLGLIKGGDK